MNKANQDISHAISATEFYTPETLAGYLAQIATELATLARDGQLRFLEYLFSMAAKEAARISGLRENI